MSKKQSANLSHLLTTYPWRFFEKVFFEKVLFFIIGHWATFLCHFDEILSVPMSVLLSVCQLDQFVVKKALSNFFSPSITDIDRKLISLCSNFFRPGWRHCLLRVQGINLTNEKRFDKSLFVSLIICGPWAKKSRLFRKTIGSVVKMAYHVSKEIFCREFFFEKVLFLFQHWALSELFMSFRRKFVGPVVSTAFCLSIDQFVVKKFLSNIFFTSFLDIHPKVISFRSNFFSAKMTTLLSTSPKDHFEVITLFWQSFCLFFQWFLESERRNNGFFCHKNNWQICHICLPRIQEDFLKRFFLKKKTFFSSLGIEQLLYVLSTKYCQSRCQYCFRFVN